jgi:hypothetical protein
VVDAFVLGAVPPYAGLLGGKLVAMLAISNEVREAFRRKYAQHETVIGKREFSGELALITTTSALGRSSLYNRLNFNGRRLFARIGATRGFGDLYFTNGLYADLSSFAQHWCTATAKKDVWGSGFRNRREVIRKALSGSGLSPDIVYHGVQREVFAAPLADNSIDFLRGECDQLNYFDFPAERIVSFFRTRWLIPRASRDNAYRAFNPESLRIWSVNRGRA